MLCEAAQHGASKRHPLNSYWVRLCPRHGYKRTVIITAHRLARILYAMWRKKEDFDSNKLNVVEEEGIYPKKYYWRLRTSAEHVVVV
jgi:hypothetical protein